MEYAVYKLTFPGAVHFGQGTLPSTSMTFAADRLFSALSFEALSQGEDKLNRLVTAAREGKLLFSDAFPFSGEEYFCIRPILRPPHQNREEDVDKRKIFKKLEFLPLSRFDDYMEGKAKAEDLRSPTFGKFTVRTSVNIEPGEDALPYRIGTFMFNEDCGLYILLGYEGKDILYFAEDLLTSLSSAGIGGKRSAGMGRFEMFPGKLPQGLKSRLSGNFAKYMTLAAVLPMEYDMETVLKGASFLLEKKSGFVASADYAPEWRRKRDVFAFKAGSCFARKFSGQVRDVSNGGRHPVYRYLEPLFMGVL